MHFASGIGLLFAMKMPRDFCRLQTMIERNRTMIVFSMEIVAPDEKRTAILRTLGSLLGPTRVAPGCMDARLYADLDRRKTLLLVEEWQSREQFDCNLDFRKLSTLVAVIELSDEAPVIRVDSVEREEGINTLAAPNRRAADNRDDTDGFES
jgi:quinol monooxygenase YgiN